jgi:actin-related protein 9
VVTTEFYLISVISSYEHRKYAIFSQLHLRRTLNESPFLLSIFPGLQRSSYERICQIFFERFNVAGLGILDRPMAQLYAANVLSGIVVDIGLEKTDVSTIYEGVFAHPRMTSTNLGIQDCERYLAHLLRSNQSVMAAVNPPDSQASSDTIQERLLEFVKYIWEHGYVKVPSTGESALLEDEGVTDIAAIVMAGKEKAVIESGIKKKQTAKQSAAEQARAREIEAMDLITITWKEKEITLGKERHRFCEPLFDPELLKNIDSDYMSWEPSVPETESPLPLHDLVGQAVMAAEVDFRVEMYRGLFVTGDLTRQVQGMYYFVSVV